MRSTIATGRSLPIGSVSLSRWPNVLNSVRRKADVSSILVRVIVSTVAVTALLLLVLLAAASANTEFFDRYYSWLYAANIAVALVFLLIVLALVVMIVARLRKG